jgi:glucose-1-phosphate thymidylyltransferase
VRRVGVIPAAGHAIRLQPLSLSKEVYPVRGRPVMDYIVERMRLAPCEELLVVTRPEKVDVLGNARRHGATVVEARPGSLGESLATGLRALADDDVALIGFPDSIWEPADGFRSVLRLLEAGWELALGLFRAPDADLRRYEPVIHDPEGLVDHIEFKPERPSSDWIWGCAAASARTLRRLDGREEPGPCFNELARRRAVGAVRLSECYIDIGTKEGLRRAVAA